MEKSMRGGVSPDELTEFTSPSLLFTTVAGFGFFWTALFSLIARNAFLDASDAPLWQHPALRIALLIGFGGCAFALSRMAGGSLSRRAERRCMAAVAAAAATICAYATAQALLAGTANAADGALAALAPFAWVVSGAGLCCLLFLWLPVLGCAKGRRLALCLGAASALGGVLYLATNLLPAVAGSAAVSLCAVASLGARAAAMRDGGCEDGPIPFAQSKKSAGLSWSFGAVYIAYGVVLGLGAGSVAQIEGSSALYIAAAAAMLAGAGSAALFICRFAERVRQSDVLRMLSPFLVAALVPMAAFPGDRLYALCNLLLLACYVFLLLVSIAYELNIARKRHVSALFLVGMSQTALCVGMAAGLGLKLLSSITGMLNHTMLSVIALGLVVALAVLVAFAPTRMNGTGNLVLADKPSASEPQSEKREGRWHARCAAVARKASLSARETEVFMLLAKGRGIEHIQKKLCISGHTVKTHTYNIYRKMGIGSREELLDAIEAAGSASENPPDAMPPRR